MPQVLSEASLLDHCELLPAALGALPFLIERHASLAVKGVVLQAAELLLVVDLPRGQFQARVSVGAAAVDGRLLAAFDAAEHVGDKPVVVEGSQVGLYPLALVVRDVGLCRAERADGGVEDLVRGSKLLGKGGGQLLAAQVGAATPWYEG